MITQVTRHEREGIVYYTVPSFDETGKVRHLFSAAPGDMDLALYGERPKDVIRDNYRRLCGLTGLDAESLVLSRQVHGNTIHIPGSLDRGLEAPGLMLAADGHVTDRKGYTLVKLTADCVPVLLLDPVGGAIAAVHAGWKGTAAHIASKAVRVMARMYGSRPENILAAIGPHICARCYEVDDRVISAFLAAYDGAVCFEPSRPEHYLLSLTGYNALDLTDAGVREEHITDTGLCTLEDGELYSYRRSGAAAGRLGAFIGLK